MLVSVKWSRAMVMVVVAGVFACGGSDYSDVTGADAEGGGDAAREGGTDSDAAREGGTDRDAARGGGTDRDAAREGGLNAEQAAAANADAEEPATPLPEVAADNDGGELPDATAIALEDASSAWMPDGDVGPADGGQLAETSRESSAAADARAGADALSDGSPVGDVASEGVTTARDAGVDGRLLIDAAGDASVARDGGDVAQGSDAAPDTSLGDEAVGAASADAAPDSSGDDATVDAAPEASDDAPTGASIDAAPEAAVDEGPEASDAAGVRCAPVLGSYRATYVTRSGTCGAVAAHDVTFNETSAPGTSECPGTSTLSADGCSSAFDVTCIVSGGVALRTVGTSQAAVDATSVTSPQVLTITRNGVAVCSGAYDVTYVQQ